MFARKTYEWTQKSFPRWFDQKKSLCGVLKIDACAAAKHKIILSLPKMCWINLIKF